MGEVFGLTFVMLFSWLVRAFAAPLAAWTVRSYEKNGWSFISEEGVRVWYRFMPYLFTTGWAVMVVQKIRGR